MEGAVDIMAGALTNITSVVNSVMTIIEGNEIMLAGLVIGLVFGAVGLIKSLV